jgi:hypothetical protein
MGPSQRITAFLRTTMPLIAATILMLPTPIRAAAAQPGASPKPLQTKPCLIADPNQLRRQWRFTSHRRLQLLTNYIGAGSRIQAVLSGPPEFPADYKGSKSIADIDFRAFFVDTPKDRPSYAVGWTENLHEGAARLFQSELPPDVAQALDVDAKSYSLLQVDVPTTAANGLLPQLSHLAIVGCLPGLATPVLWAGARARVVAVWPPILAAVLLDVILYLSAVTWVYFARNRTAEADAKASVGQNTDVTPVFRVQTLRRWTWWECLDPVVLSSDVFDRGSLAKLQILFFTLLVAYGLVFITMRTGQLSSISSTVVYLLGISALGALGTKVASTSRDRLSSRNWAWLVSRQVLPINDPGKEGRPRWTDLVMSDAELDIYKLQALVFSVIVGVAMIMGGFSLATFSVPQELLEILGLSQLVFVGGRFAGATTLGDLDDLVNELRKREQQLRQAAASGIDVDADGKPVLGPDGKPVPPKDGAPFKTLADARSNVPIAFRRYMDTKDEVAVLLESMVHRSIETKYLDNPLLA